jgi:hypothetical protein
VVDQLLIKFLTMKHILEKCGEQSIDAHHLFIDFQAAYDPVWRKEIWSAMHKPGPPPKIS